MSIVKNSGRLLAVFTLLILVLSIVLCPISFCAAAHQCKTESKKDDDKKKGAKTGEPTFVQVSSRSISSVNYGKPKLELSSNSSTEVLFSYDKSLITTTPEMQIVSSLPAWLTIEVNPDVIDLGDPQLKFIELTFTVAAGVTPNSNTEVDLKLVDVGPQEIKGEKKVVATVDRTLFSQISIPVQGSLVRANVPVFGLAYGENFNSYTVEYGAGYNPEVWTTVVTSNVPQTNDTSPVAFTEANLTIYGNLATWEAGLTEYYYPWYPWSVDLNGIYTVRLTVEDSFGKSVSDETVVQVGRVMGSTYSATAISPDSKVLLIVPEQAIKDDFVVIGIDTISNQAVSLDEGYNIVGNVYELQPPGLEFTKDVTLEINYTDTDLGTKDETKIGIYAYNPETNHWEYVSTTTVDLDNNKAAVTLRKITSGYAYYAILEKTFLSGKPVLDQPASPTQNRLVSMSGTADIGVSVEIFINGISKGVATSDSNGIFKLDNVLLNTGLNTIAAKAIDEYNQQSLMSDAVTVETVEPQITVDSIKFKDESYSADFAGTVYLGDTLYIELIGTDYDMLVQDMPSVIIESSVTAPDGIEIQLTETGLSTGIYRGEAIVGIESSCSTGTIAAYEDGELIAAISKIDNTKSVTVTVADYIAPVAPKITSSTHPSICQSTFEPGFDGWSNRDGEVGAALYLNNTQRSDSTNCLELVNSQFGGNFASNVISTSFNTEEYPIISFDYKIKENTKINFLVKLENDDMWYDIIFTDTAKNYWRMNMEQIGVVEGVIKDDTWKNVSFDLYEMLKTKTGNFQVKEIIMADWDTAGYMKLVYGTSPAGTTYYLDNFMINKRGFVDKDPQFTILDPVDPSGIAGYSFVLDQVPGTIPDMVVDSTTNLVNFTDVDDGLWYFHGRVQDGSGNWSKANHYKIIIDTHGPCADTPTPMAYTSSGDPTISIHLTDNQGTGVDTQTIKLKVEGTEYDINSPALNFDEGTEALTFNPSAIAIIWPDHHLVNVELTQADDYLGNILQNPLSWEWTLDYSLDTTPPDAPEIISPAIHNLTLNKVPFMWRAEDANGIADYSFILDQSPTTVPDDEGEGLITSKIYDLAVGTYYFHVKAQDRPGNWSETVHYEITISENTSLLINDFDDGSDPNEVSGYSGIWNSDGAICEASYYNTDLNNVYGGSGYSLELNYDVTQQDTCAGYWTAICVDLSDYKALTFWVKGTVGGEKLKIGLKDSYWNETKLLVNEYLSSGVTTSWQKVVIPLSVFGNIANWTSMGNISLSFDNCLGVPTSGTVYIDEFRFEKIAEPIIVSNFNGAGDYNALGGSFETFTGGAAAISAGYDSNNTYNNSAYGYNITYSGITSWDNHAGWKTLLNNLDASNCNTLSFYIKGSIGGEKPNIYLGYSKYNSYNKRYVDIERYVTVTTGWQKVNIPLLDFIMQGVDITDLIEIQVIFEWEDMSGIIYLEDIEFNNVSYNEAPVVDTISDITNQENITITGCGTPGETIIPVVEVPYSGKWEQTPVTVGEDGTFSAVVNISGEGQKQIYVYAVDDNGNITLNSATQVILLDQTAPFVPTINEINSPTLSPDISVSGLAESNTTVYIKLTLPNSASVEYTQEALTGSYSTDITLSDGDGAYQIVTASEDNAGNISFDSDAVEVVLDAVNEAPSISVISPDGEEIISSGTFNILWQAADSDPTDSLSIDIQNTNSLNQVLVDNFDGGNYENSLNAWSATWNADGAVIEDIFNSETAVVYENTGMSLQLNYDVTAQAESQAGFWTGLYTQPDMSAYGYISFLVKGAVGGEIFTVGLKDSYSNETKLSVINYLSNGVTAEWQRVTIALTDFANIDISSLDNFSISFVNSIGSGSGTLYLDEIRFIKWQDLALSQSNDGIYSWKTIGLSQSDRYLVKLTATDLRGGVDTAESENYFTLSNNLAEEKTALASSEENGSVAASMAVDGSLNTRWSSEHSDPQWCQVDLGEEQPVNKVILRWETAYGKSYAIEVSDDSLSWQEVYSTATGDGDIDEIEFNTVNARYIRFYGTERGTTWGYSLWEFEVYYDAHHANITASSVEGAGLESEKAFDGDLNTRWSSAHNDNEWIYIDFNIPKTFNTVILNWESAYAESYELQVSDDASNWTTIYSSTSSDGKSDVIYVGEQTARYLKVNCIQRGTEYGNSLWEINILTTTAFASSIEETGVEADKAVDGNLSTRWSAEHSDPQWIEIDFSSIQTINKATLNWETAYGKSYQLQISDDTTNWQDIYSTTTGGGGIDEIIFPAVNTRYLRMYGTERGTGWGYSIWEMESGYE